MATNPYHWWINPVRKQPLWYQYVIMQIFKVREANMELARIYTTENLRYTLQADVGDDLANANPPVKPSVHFCIFRDVFADRHSYRSALATTSMGPLRCGHSRANN